MKYETICNSKVIDEIKSGTEVYMIDKFERYTYIANKCTIGHILKAVQDETGRYEFYKEK